MLKISSHKIHPNCTSKQVCTQPPTFRLQHNTLRIISHPPCHLAVFNQSLITKNDTHCKLTLKWWPTKECCLAFSKPSLSMVSPFSSDMSVVKSTGKPYVSYRRHATSPATHISFHWLPWFKHPPTQTLKHAWRTRVRDLDICVPQNPTSAPCIVNKHGA